MGCSSLSVHKPSSLEVLNKEASQGDVLGPFVEAKLVAEAEC